MAKWSTGDEFQGSRAEIASFIKKIWTVGGTVRMTSHDTVKIMSLPIQSSKR